MSGELHKNGSQNVEQRHRRERSIFFPLLLISVGVILFLNTIGMIPGNTLEIVIRLWPLLFIIGGLDDLLNRRNAASAILGIGVGCLFLLWYSGYFFNTDVNIWDILYLWPILLISWGINIVLGHRTYLSFVLGILMGIGLVAVVVWLLYNPLYKTMPLSEGRIEAVVQPLEGATEATVHLSPQVGSCAISAGASSENLVEGELSLMRGETLSVPLYSISGPRGSYFLESQLFNRFFFVPVSRSIWDLKLNSDIPQTLDFSLIVGELDIDLSGLLVERLNIESPVGHVYLVLPEEGDFTGNIDMAVGELVIVVPEGTSVRINADTAVTNITKPADYRSAGGVITSPDAATADQIVRLSIDLPVGSLVIQESP